MSTRLLTYCCLLMTVLLTTASAEAQQSIRIPRIGYLVVIPLSANADLSEAFRQGLRDLGYIEGKNIFIEWRSGEGARGWQERIELSDSYLTK